MLASFVSLSSMTCFIPAFKVKLSIEALSLDVKYEFNSDNKRMYSGKNGTIILAEGEIIQNRGDNEQSNV